MASVIASIRDGVTLNLSEEEAATLAAILAYVGGDPTKSARRHASAVSRALQDAGHHFARGLAEEFHNRIGAQLGITFENNPEPFKPGYFRDRRDGEIAWLNNELGDVWSRVTVLDENDNEITSAETD